MQAGEYIKDRLMVKIIANICQENNISFVSLSDDWLLELRKGDKVWQILGYKFSLNDAVAAAISADKVATYTLLSRAGISSVEHILLRPKISTQQKAALSYLQKVVVKPLDGSGGQNVRLFDSSNQAINWIESTDISAWALSPFYDLKNETRIILLDGELLLAYQKQPTLKDGLKMFNLGLGATPKDIQPDDDMITMARLAQSTLGLRLSAIDIVETIAGEKFILEVNSGFMMEHYASYSLENYEKVSKLYEIIINTLMK